MINNCKGLMSLTWSAVPITPNEDFDGAPLLRTEFGLEEGHGLITLATPHATHMAFLRHTSTAIQSPTTC